MKLQVSGGENEKGILCLNARTQLWEHTYSLTQQRVLTVLVQIEAEVAI